MGTRAYFMINMEKRFSDDGYYLDALRELEAMPEVKAVNAVSGMCDLLVKVEAPVRVIFVANKIRAKKWVKDFHLLKVEYPEILVTSDLVKTPAPFPEINNSPTT